MSKRPSTGKDAPQSGIVRGLVGGNSVPESDELDSVRGEQDPYRTQLREIEGERNRLHAQLRDALAQVEYWRTLAEYRKAMLDAQRDSTGQTPLVSVDGPPN